MELVEGSPSTERESLGDLGHRVHLDQGTTDDEILLDERVGVPRSERHHEDLARCQHTLEPFSELVLLDQREEVAETLDPGDGGTSSFRFQSVGLDRLRELGDHRRDVVEVAAALGIADQLQCRRRWRGG